MNDVQVKCECGELMSLRPDLRGTQFTADWSVTVRRTFDCDCGNTLGVFVTAGLADDAHAYKDREWLVEAYSVQGRTMAEIASSCGVSAMTIHNWLHRFGIETRPRGRKS